MPIFQSLFCWMLVWKDYPISVGFYGSFDFNPCFAGCWSGRQLELEAKKLLKAFQSLFCWMLVWKKDGQKHYITEIFDFNPCFAGCWSGSQYCINRQSILYVISILVLLDVGLEEEELERFPILRMKFQSLFCWMLVWKSLDSHC